MQYNGGCIIGVEQRTGASYPGAASQKWPFDDGAWTPNADYYISSTGYSITLPPGGNAILLGTSVDVYPRPDLALPYDKYLLYINNTANTTTQMIGTSPRRLVITTDNALENATQDNRLQYRSSMSGAAHVSGSEINSAMIQELPNNQELVSYNRTPTAPTMLEIKTMDGARRQYVTGSASTSLAATFTWSDNGTIAAKIDNILMAARVNAWPLIVYIPAGIYFNGPFMDLVIPDNNPRVVMTAPGVYQVTIEGTCQP